ncbi:acetyltransferase, GNAT family protein [Tritrichomonas foetus]|uniref:Acetyltransferase, GNAT family protein n=1 Tax=Tritrichomonas foetus TaxID=1144522 RepID=A0A1J4J7N0_9EUKA|nr:acetyltransferase, GNAT family protein [Tritrichomonas foetus]|eukprot:OHS95226.1 acetyltransferase, GNAT family protein [Tritrichomonas foetus]
MNTILTQTYSKILNDIVQIIEAFEKKNSITKIKSSTMSLTIRNGRKDDFNYINNALRDIMRICFKMDKPFPNVPGSDEAYDEILRDKEHNEVLIAEIDGKRVGTALVTYAPIITMGGKTAEIQDLYVDPAARGKGVGKALIQKIHDIAKEKNIKGMYLIQPSPGTEQDEERNLFYKRQGFFIGGFARFKVLGEYPVF